MINHYVATGTAPTYAADGSQGYHIEVVRTYDDPGGGSGRTVSHGWVLVGDDGRTVYATTDSGPWRAITTVNDAAELTPDWIADNAALFAPGYVRS